MVSGVLITVSGNVNTISNLNVNNLGNYMKPKRSDKPKLLYSWNLDNGESIKLYGFVRGKERFINKHELVPPVDNNLYYGDLILYKLKNRKKVNFSADDYHKWYQSVYQFEDLDDDIIEDELFSDDQGSTSDNEYDYEDGWLVKD